MAVPGASGQSGVINPAAGDPEDRPEPERTDGPARAGRTVRRAGRWRGLVLGVLAALVVASVGVSGWLLAAPGPDPDEAQARRELVMGKARQFMLAVNTYGPDDLADDGTMPDYRERVSELITPKFRTDFEENVRFAEQTVAQAGLGRTAEVHGVGVATLDEDSATVLVAGSFTNSYPRGGRGDRADERVEDRPAPFRVEVELVHTGGEWLVDTFTPVTGETQP